MQAPSDTRTHHHVPGKHHSDSELTSISKQLSDGDLSLGTISDLSKHDINPLSSYDARDNDPNRSSYNSTQTHFGDSDSSSGSGVQSKRNASPSDSSPASVLPPGAAFSSSGDYLKGAKHQQQQGAASVNQQKPLSCAGVRTDSSPSGTAASSVLPQGAPFLSLGGNGSSAKHHHKQGTKHVNHGMETDEYDNDRNKHQQSTQYDDQSLASKVIGKVKHAIGADDTHKHHDRDHNSHGKHKGKQDKSIAASGY